MTKQERTERDEAILSRHQAGEGYAAIAAAEGVSESTARTVVKKARDAALAEAEAASAAKAPKGRKADERTDAQKDADYRVTRALRHARKAVEVRGKTSPIGTERWETLVALVDEAR